MFGEGNLLGRITQAAVVILLVAIACDLGWHLIRPVVPSLVVLAVIGIMFSRVLLRR